MQLFKKDDDVGMVFIVALLALVGYAVTKVIRVLQTDKQVKEESKS